MLPDDIKGAAVKRMRESGERIANLRQAFSLREGINSLKFKLPDRMIGVPPHPAGPLAGITVDWQTMAREYLQEMDWDQETGRPSAARKSNCEAPVAKMATARPFASIFCESPRTTFSAAASA